MRTQRLRPTHWFNWLVLAVIFALFGMSPQTALAQCGDIPEESTCKTCHEEAYPVYGTGEWHDIHARKDCCWNCHGGNSQSMDQDIAHAGMTLNPLTDTYQDCYACHPYDYDDRAVAFGTLLKYGTRPDHPNPVSSGQPGTPARGGARDRDLANQPAGRDSACQTGCRLSLCLDWAFSFWWDYAWPAIAVKPVILPTPERLIRALQASVFCCRSCFWRSFASISARWAAWRACFLSPSACASIRCQAERKASSSAGVSGISP